MDKVKRFQKPSKSATEPLSAQRKTIKTLSSLWPCGSVALWLCGKKFLSIIDALLQSLEKSKSKDMIVINLPFDKDL
jgi:hypothetical protein